MAAIVIGSDHGGYRLKEFLKSRIGGMVDVGAYGEESSDYPDFAFKVAEFIRENPGAYGVLACRSGQGMAMAVNRFPFIRGALLFSLDLARLAREHEDANVAILSADYFSDEQNLEFLRVFLSTPFSNEERHVRRIGKYAGEVV
ncbi:MAG: RpiB/LacA/LacB family sugar-phosphate isomerase [Rickettsiales bacterium]|jgi:ribose 5-phosphate isomerase B|nr:RpiB/LacA/LacB family sugar-phosphate isomerase [Rickettsiales bacterium]